MCALFFYADKDNDGQLDPYELESLFYREVNTFVLSLLDIIS